jgi:hypothetical protein
VAESRLQRGRRLYAEQAAFERNTTSTRTSSRQPLTRRLGLREPVASRVPLPPPSECSKCRPICAVERVGLACHALGLLALDVLENNDAPPVPRTRSSLRIRVRQDRSSATVCRRVRAETPRASTTTGASLLLDGDPFAEGPRPSASGVPGVGGGSCASWTTRASPAVTMLASPDATSAARQRALAVGDARAYCLTTAEVPRDAPRGRTSHGLLHRRQATPRADSPAVRCCASAEGATSRLRPREFRDTSHRVRQRRPRTTPRTRA